MTSQGNAPEIAWEELDELYRGIILDHARKPRNQRPIEAPDVRAHVLNPFCGDEVYLDLSLRSGLVGAVRVHGQGCAISQSAASLMSEALKGKDVAQMRTLSQRFTRMMRGEHLTEVELASLGDLQALAGVARFPVRVKCALLAWNTLDEGLDEYGAGRKRS